jgi:hypothetical protein
VKRSRFIQLAGGTRSVNRELEQKAWALAGLKGYITNLRACPDGTPVTPSSSSAPATSWSRSEKSFPMAKSDLQARPVCRRKRDSIEADLTDDTGHISECYGHRVPPHTRSAAADRLSCLHAGLAGGV